MKISLKERLDKFLGKEPDVDPTAYVADSAVVIGDVTIGKYASVWPTTVLRGDIERIVIGDHSNIQDGSIIHLANDLPAIVGDWVTVGHGAIIHACTIGNECLIGMRATVMDGAVIGEQSIVGAHTLVTKGFVAPPGSMILGTPAKVVKSLDEDTRKSLKAWAEKYVETGQRHKEIQNSKSGNLS